MATSSDRYACGNRYHAPVRKTRRYYCGRVLAAVVGGLFLMLFLCC